MKKIVLLFVLMFLFGGPAFASDARPADDKNLKIDFEHLVIEVGNNGALGIKEIIFLHNYSDKKYVGETVFSVPQGAVEVTKGSGLMDCCVTLTAAGLVNTMEINPGSQQIQYGYLLKYSGDRYSLSKQIDYPTARFDLLLLDKGAKILSSKLAPAEALTIKGQRYLRLAAEDLPAKSVIDIQLANLPRIGGGYHRLLIALAALLLFSGLGYIYFFKKSR